MGIVAQATTLYGAFQQMGGRPFSIGQSLGVGFRRALPVFGVALLAASLLNRMAECWLVGWWAAHDPVAPGWVLLYPLRDLHGFVIWCASYLSKRSLWRDNNYELLEGGRLVARRANGSVVLPG